MTSGGVSPGGPIARSILFALIHDAVLLVTTALAAPRILIDGDTNPRVLLGASAVANGHTLSSRIALIETRFRTIAVAVSRDFLSNTSCWSTSACERSTDRGGTVHLPQLAKEALSASIHKVVPTIIHYFICSTGLVFHRCSQTDSRARLGSLEIFIDAFFVILTILGGTAAARSCAVAPKGKH
jgi:hypothetical protein